MSRCSSSVKVRTGRRYRCQLPVRHGGKWHQHEKADIVVKWTSLTKKEKCAGSSPEMEKPEGLTGEHLTYLDDLRASGETNMLGAAPFLVEEFGLDIRTAREYLGYWMKTFSERTQSGSTINSST